MSDYSDEIAGTKSYELCKRCKHVDVSDRFGERPYIRHCKMYEAGRRSKPITVIDYDYCIYYEQRQ